MTCGFVVPDREPFKKRDPEGPYSVGTSSLERVPIVKQQAYKRARREGLSKAAAAREAGICRQTGYAVENRMAAERQRGNAGRNRGIANSNGSLPPGTSTSKATMAAGRAGHGNPWANDYATSLGDEDLPGAIHYDELSDVAREALEDFGLFRRRYFGRGPSPWQVDAGMRIVELLAEARERREREFLVLNAPPSAGKALDLETPIPTPTGWSTMKELRVGDEVFDDQGRPTVVVAKSEVFYDHDCFIVESNDGASVVADAEHLWPVRLGGHGQYGSWKRKGDYPGKTGPKPSADGKHNHTTRFLAERSPTAKRPQLAAPPVLDLPEVDLPIEPYVLGVWLGDGHSAGARFTAHPVDAAHIVPHIEAAGFTVTQKGPMLWSVTGSARWAKDGLSTALTRSGLMHNKHIPPAYLRASAAQRLALLQGLIDTDGYVSETGRVEFTSVNRRLAEGVQELVHTLGVKASLKVGRAKVNGKDCGEKYRVGFYLASAARLPRKAQWCRRGIRMPHRYLRVHKTRSVPVQCIQVAAPSGCYLVGGGYLVTHNSTLWHDLCCWLICRDRGVRILYGSRTGTQAAKYTRRVRRALMQRDLVWPNEHDLRVGLATEPTGVLVEDFGRFKPQGRNDGDVWQMGGFTVAQVGDVLTSEKEPTITAFGFDSDYMGMRVDLAIWDDLVDPQNVRVIEVIEKLQEDWDNVAEKRTDPGGVCVLQGQRIRHNDLYRYCLDKRRAVDEEEDAPVDVEFVPMYRHIKYPAHFEDRCRGLHKRADPAVDPSRPPGDDNPGCLLDPRRLPWRDLKTAMSETPDTYRVVLQQEDLEPGTALLQKAWVDGGKDPVTGALHPGCWDHERPMWRLPEPLAIPAPNHLALSIDPSPSNWWACQLWLYNQASERRYLLALERRRMDASDFLDWNSDKGEFTGFLEDWWQRSSEMGMAFRYVVIEVNAGNKWLIQHNAATRWAQKRSVNYVSHTTGILKTDAARGIPGVKGQWRSGRIRLPGAPDGSRQEALRLVNEMLRWPHGMTDDQVMAHWFFEFTLPKLAPARTVAQPSSRRPSWMRSWRGALTG